MPGRGAQRDPVSLRFDRGARALLARAYVQPGVWVSTRLLDPSPQAVSWGRAHGIDVTGPDQPAIAGRAGLDCRTRWARGFVRALYYQHKWFAPVRPGAGWEKRLTPNHGHALQVEVGRSVTDRLGAGRVIRVRAVRGGAAAARAVARMPARRRIYTPSGQRGALASDVTRREWTGKDDD